jgi:hypothetical protein
VGVGVVASGPEAAKVGFGKHLVSGPFVRQTKKYSRAPIITNSISAARKNEEIKEINSSLSFKTRAKQYGPKHGAAQQPKRVKYLTHLPFPHLSYRLLRIRVKRQNSLLSYVRDRKYTVNVQFSVQYTLLLLYLMLVMSYCA